jgi:hypothetical protein
MEQVIQNEVEGEKINKSTQIPHLAFRPEIYGMQRKILSSPVRPESYSQGKGV